jgi:hypothetical protein
MLPKIITPSQTGVRDEKRERDELDPPVGLMATDRKLEP